jgi:hypothetical protein
MFIFVETKQTNKMKNLTVEQVKTELSKVNIYEAIDIATKRFVNACYDLGLSVEQSQRIMVSKQGLDVIAKEVAKLI